MRPQIPHITRSMIYQLALRFPGVRRRADIIGDPGAEAEPCSLMLIKKIANPIKLREEFGDAAAEILQSVTFVGFQKENWGDYSGANGILNLLPVGGIFLKRPVPGVVYRAWKPFRGYFRKRNSGYEINSAYLELNVAYDWLRKRNRIYHFLSGENEYFFSGGLKRYNRNHRIVCTFHSPVTEYLNTVFDHRKIQHIDAAVVVAGNMADFFASLIGPGRVWNIPLGVDTGYWHPGANVPGKTSRRVLFIGSHFRDFEVLRKVICAIVSRAKDVSFDAVLSAKDAMALKGLSGVTIHTNIDDSQLRTLYQTSDLFICPLLQCTASLSLLEAMACGLPIVATRTGGVPDYVTAESGVLTGPGDAEEMAEAILRLLDDETGRARMSGAARQQALELDWKVIALRLTEVYRSLQANQ